MPARYTDITGQSFGLLTVTGYAGSVPSTRGRVHLWNVVCVCGTEKAVRVNNLRYGTTKSCGTCTRNKPHDHTGKVFGRLTAIRAIEGTRPTTWLCRCECGNEVQVNVSNLLMSRTRSCGCLRDEARRGIQRNRWKAEVTYRTAHRRTETAKGRASEHTCVDCDEQAHEWSYIGGDPNERVSPEGLRYSMEPEWYVARCRIHHQAHDAVMRRTNYGAAS